MQNLCNISRKNWGMKLIFGQMSTTVFYKLILSFWWLWPGIPELLKIIGMQCLCTISRKHWVTKWKSYKLIVFFLMGLPRHAQSTRVNLQYFDDILRKKSGIKFDLFKYYSYNLLYIQCFPIIDPFPLSIWNPYPYSFHHLIVCLI